MQNLLKDNSATWWAQVLEFFVCLLIFFLPLLLGWFVGSLFRFIHNVTFRHKDNKKIHVVFAAINFWWGKGVCLPPILDPFTDLVVFSLVFLRF